VIDAGAGAAGRCCNPCGSRSPACSAMVQQFWRGPAGSPRTNAPPRRRVSIRGNRAAIRASSRPSPPAHLAAYAVPTATT